MTDQTAQPGKDPATGRFQPGNKFWLARSSHGRNPKFESAEMLLDACLQYFEWVEANPLYEAKAFAYEGEVTIEEIPKMRAMTLDGLTLFIGVTLQTWFTWRTHPDFSDVIGEVEKGIRMQKFGGAAAGLLNANIIARDLGLADKAELTGKDGGPIEMLQVTDEMRAKALANFIARTNKG